MRAARRSMSALIAMMAAAWLLTAAAPAAQAPHLKPLAGVDDLKAWFNGNRAHPRLVFLLSPT